MLNFCHKAQAFNDCFSKLWQMLSLTVELQNKIYCCTFSTLIIFKLKAESMLACPDKVKIITVLKQSVHKD